MNSSALVDYSGKVEHISEAFRTISTRVGIKLDTSDIPIKNDSGAPDEFRSAYSEKAIAIVNQRYQKDFRLFGYSPNFTTVIEGGKTAA